MREEKDTLLSDNIKKHPTNVSNEETDTELAIEADDVNNENINDKDTDNTPIRVGNIIYDKELHTNVVDETDDRLTWDLDIYFAVLIRDYLRSFNKANTLLIPNFIYERNKGKMTFEEALETLDEDEMDKQAHEVIEDLANKFDYIANFLDMEHVNYDQDQEKYDRYVKEAFETLAEIFPSLWW